MRAKVSPIAFSWCENVTIPHHDVEMALEGIVYTRVTTSFAAKGVPVLAAVFVISCEVFLRCAGCQATRPKFGQRRPAQDRALHLPKSFC